MGKDRKRRIFALFAHAPGLWICYRERLGPELRRANRIAIVATLAAMLAPVLWLRPWTKAALIAGVAWLVGHFAWGAYLAWKLPPRRSGRE